MTLDFVMSVMHCCSALVCWLCPTLQLRKLEAGNGTEAFQCMACPLCLFSLFLPFLQLRKLEAENAHLRQKIKMLEAIHAEVSHRCPGQPPSLGHSLYCPVSWFIEAIYAEVSHRCRGPLYIHAEVMTDLVLTS